MNDKRLLPGETGIEAALVQRLIAGQCPRWAGLPLTRVASAGTDNALFRLGTDKVVRLPRFARVAGQIAKETHWLPRLRPLPLTIPTPLAQGAPAHGYPYPWAVYRWIDGETAALHRLADRDAATRAVAEFVRALQAIDAAGGPAAGAQNEDRGLAPAVRDGWVRKSIAALSDELDVAAVTAIWDEIVALPNWQGPGVWLHGDLQAGNMLVRDGVIVAVIDFGLLGIGDPAADLTAAWTFFGAETRPVYRTALGVDDATWARGRGWALASALIARATYRGTNRALASASLRTIAEVLADRGLPA